MDDSVQESLDLQKEKRELEKDIRKM